jgi:GTP-binding protein EngB required for normal cell division
VADVLTSGPPKAIYNIVVVGETGVGKSSFINLVIGTTKAETANNVRGVTIGTTCYEWEKRDTETFCLWDTPGLGEGSAGSVSPKRAQDALLSLLTELHKASGIHLLVFCMRGTSRVTKGVKQTYDSVIGIRDKVSPGIPVVAAVTELEKKSSLPDIVSSMEEWWTGNPDGLSDLTFPGHACITTLTDDCHPIVPGRHDHCQKLVRQLGRSIHPSVGFHGWYQPLFVLHAREWGHHTTAQSNYNVLWNPRQEGRPDRLRHSLPSKRDSDDGMVESGCQDARKERYQLCRTRMYDDVGRQPELSGVGRGRRTSSLAVR